MSDDDSGMLGGLPRERPGTRSARRAAKGPRAGGERAATRKQPASSKRAAGEPAARARAAAAAPPERSADGGGPLPDPIRLAGGAARAGARAAAGLLRRIPRP